MGADVAQGAAVAERQRNSPIPLYNGVISPDKWTTFGRMAHTFANTEFVDKGLRGRPEAIMACLVYGDSLGLHPSAALKEVYVADGKVGISGALMLALIRNAGHKVIWEEITSDDPANSGLLGDGFVGWRCIGQRMKARKVVDEDSWTYSMEDAKRAGLYPNTSDKAAWMKTPKLMCRWRALAQVARFLFSDVFMGQAVYLPDEAEEVAYSNRAMRNGAAESSSAEPEDIQIDYGSDPDLAAWLIALIARANEVEPGRYLPKKVKLLLHGVTDDERAEFAIEVAEWLSEQGIVPPVKPSAESETEDAGDVEIVDEGDDPGLAEE